MKVKIKRDMPFRDKMRLAQIICKANGGDPCGVVALSDGSFLLPLVSAERFWAMWRCQEGN